MSQSSLDAIRASIQPLDLSHRLIKYFVDLGDRALNENGQPAIRDLYGAALAYRDIAGCSVFPTIAGVPDPKRLKRPAVPTWAAFQDRLPTYEELEHHFKGANCGIAVVCGRVSGDLEVLDFEVPDVFERFKEKVIAEKGETYWQQFYVVKTPSFGRHIYYRCPDGVTAGMKLAARPVDGPAKIELLIETRGEGHYVLGACSPASAHPDNREYKIEQLTPEEIPSISAEERKYLLDVARSFNEVPQNTFQALDIHQRIKPPRPPMDNSGGRPGDDFNQRADWSEILVPHGWSYSHERAGITYWTRPGKDPSEGHSASTGYGGDYLHVFSSSVADLQQGRSYGKFTVYAMLNHGGDFARAAKQLVSEGYGPRVASLTWAHVEADSVDAQPEPPELEALPAQAPSKTGSTKASGDRYRLVDIAEAECDIFRDQFGGAMATIRATWCTLDLDSPQFKGWLDTRHRALTGRLPAPDTTSSAVETLSRQAANRASETVYTRYATVEIDGETVIYVNLMDGKNYVEIKAGGVRVIDRPKVRMKSGSETSRPLPVPDLTARKHDLLDLRHVINISEEQEGSKAEATGDLCLLLGYLVGCVSSEGPFPVLAITGEQGSAKSSAIEIVRAILDPDEIEHIDMPENILDLRAAVKAMTLLPLDNVSKLSSKDSDSLCRVATGGSIVSRALYTNDKLASLKVCRPILLNSIPAVSERGDLMDRSISIRLPSLADGNKKRKNKKKVIIPTFKKMLPRVLGALYRAVSASLKNTYECTSNIRMIECVERIGAAESELPWQPGLFEKLVEANRDNSLQDAAEANPVVAAVIEFAGEHSADRPCTGSWGFLLAQVAQRCKSPPDTERGLQSILARSAAVLRAKGVVVEKVGRDNAGTKIKVYRSQPDENPAKPGIIKAPPSIGDVDDLDSPSAFASERPSARMPETSDGGLTDFDKFFGQIRVPPKNV